MDCQSPGLDSADRIPRVASSIRELGSEVLGASSSIYQIVVLLSSARRKEEVGLSAGEEVRVLRMWHGPGLVGRYVQLIGGERAIGELVRQCLGTNAIIDNSIAGAGETGVSLKGLCQ